MICYALATCFNAKEFNWFIPDSTFNSSRLFAQKPVQKWKQEITDFCSSLEIGLYNTSKNDNHYFYALKLTPGVCFIACDTELTFKQFNMLVNHLLFKKIALETVGNNLEQYTKDQEVEALKQQLDELTIEAKKTIERIIERGDKIEDLVNQTQNLPEVSFSFPRTEKSILPSCVLI